MLFNSIHYLLFLPIVAIIYFLLPAKPRWGPAKPRQAFLLLASFYFYWVFSIPLSLLLVYSTLLDYTTARIIGGTSRRSVRKGALVASIVGNLLVLGLFKYYNFFSDSIASAFGGPLLPTLQLILPMGISFYTFQTMSYTIDVYRGKIKPTRSILEMGLYVSFFPQLVAGPIMRGSTLMPQFREVHHPNADRILSGVLLVLWGLFKKVFVADPMGRIVDSIYGTPLQPIDPSVWSGAALLVATYAFAVQIYCDFSAYTDIARGSGRILGFRIMRNFNAPYLATSITEFWRRWHISLSTWLRDYLYIPLGGNRKGVLRTYLSLGITMLLGGLWHGANWTFVIWGGLHGLYLALERLLGFHALERKPMRPSEKCLRGFVTFHLVCLAWVFFRSPDLNYALETLFRILTMAQGNQVNPLPLGWLLVLVASQIGRLRDRVHEFSLQRTRLSRWVAYGSFALLVVVLSTARTPEFIYFQF